MLRTKSKNPFCPTHPSISIRKKRNPISTKIDEKPPLNNVRLPVANKNYDLKFIIYFELHRLNK